LEKAKETFTIKELSQLFEVSAQAMRQRIEKLDDTEKLKNADGHWVILLEGVRKLEERMGKQVLAHETDKSDNDKENQLVLIEQLNFQKMQYQDLAIKFDKMQESHQEQLRVKDKQIEDLILKINTEVNKQSFWSRIFKRKG
jgi:hypothetical protein